MRNKLLVIAALLIGPFFIYTGVKEKQTLQAIEDHGVATPGIIEGGETRTRKGVKSYKLTVGYQTKEGTRHSKTFSAPKDFVVQHVDLEANQITNDAVEVRYLPENPSEAALVGAPDDPMTAIYIGIVVLLAGVIGAIFVFKRKQPAEPPPVPSAAG